MRAQYIKTTGAIGDRWPLESNGVDPLPDLKIPPDLTKPTADDRYAVPDVSAKGGTLLSDYDKERRIALDPSKTAVLPAQSNARAGII